LTPNRTVIAATLPSGFAAADHTWKFGLRTSSSVRHGRMRAISYGPVAGGKRSATLWADTAIAAGNASLSRNAASGAVRCKVIVPAALSTTIPRERSHAAGRFTQRAAPTMPV
jgi:hypothetical protein